MKDSVRTAIYQAIIKQHWLEVNYKNKKEETTTFLFGIKSIDLANGKISGEIFNCYKSLVCVDSPFPLNLEGIMTAIVVDQSFFPTPQKLLSEVENNEELRAFLNVEFVNNNILCYLSDCYENDSDPYLKDTVMIDGIICSELLKNRCYTLDDKQFADIIGKVFKGNLFEAEKQYRFQTLAFNVLSLEVNNKEYVIAYRNLTLNFKNRTLMMSQKASFNKSFIFDKDKKISLASYLDISPEEFCEGFSGHVDEYTEQIRGNCHHGERIVTRPNIFLLSRNVFLGVENAIEAIHEMGNKKELTQPLKAFFGTNRNGTGTSKSANIVVFDKKKINIDQMRVVHNSMVNHVTYVQGPPGTGKTETIFNILLSAYANEKTVLVCSNNNHPVDDIFRKMNNSFSDSLKASGYKTVFPFPIMRLGNNNEMSDTVFRLRDILETVENTKDIVIPEEYRKKKETSLAGFQALKDLLVRYEARKDLEATIETLKRVHGLAEKDNLKETIREQIHTQEKKLNAMPEIHNEEVLQYAVSASEDASFMEYLYYSALSRYRILLADSFEELREILLQEDTEVASEQFVKYLKDNKNLHRFLQVFPIIACTNLSVDKLGEAKPHFDLCIMDEAGQCNIASSLISIVRAKDLLLVGDVNQLQPVTVLDVDYNEKLISRYHIHAEYNYVRNSILSTMLAVDRNSKSILLSYHYRCGHRIAEFVNERFYQSRLKLENQLPGDLTYVNVDNRYQSEERNSYDTEARAIVKTIKNNHYRDCAVITPFVNQSALINKYLQAEGITDVKSGTIHTLQGSEKSVIVFSSALSPRTYSKSMEWLKDNHELINVAVTRAKNTFVFVGDKKAIDALSKGKTNDIKALSDYVFSNGTVIVPPAEKVIISNFSNDSRNERAFFETISPYFNRKNSRMKIERNVPVRTAISGVRPEDEKLIGKKEFDVIVQAAGGTLGDHYHTIAVFEIDGAEHLISEKTFSRDREKEEACRKYGIKLFRIANSQVKDFQLIIHTFEASLSDIKDMEQLSLFDF